jgi:hypothetical protein
LPDPKPLGPIGTWSACSGELTLTDTQFRWLNIFGSCTLEGVRKFADEVLSLSPGDLSDCADPPWWLASEDGTPAQFSAAVALSRLSLIPTDPAQAGRIAQFEEHLLTENWVFTTPEGYINDVYLCSTEDGFFGGMYKGVDDSCEFLSCGGGIHSQTISDDRETLTTSCQGDCPCGGVITIDERTETSLSGSYHGYNCARLLDGTFTGRPMSL